MEKTNAARLLSAASIAYELIPYEYTEDDLSATHVAQTLGEDIERVFKTLVLRGLRVSAKLGMLLGNAGTDPQWAKSPAPWPPHGLVSGRLAISAQGGQI